MPRSHHDIISEYEGRLKSAIIAFDKKELNALIDPDIMFVNEFGEHFRGLTNTPSHSPNYKVYNIEILSREIGFFNSVAISITMEVRSGMKDGYDFITKICMTRVWRFDGRNWKLINATAVSC